LELRKQLLIAESELNRAQLAAEWQGMAHGATCLAQRAKTVAAWASSAALLVAGVRALRASPPQGTAVKVSWVERILDGARVASTIWVALRGRGEKAGDG
jgi:hypothetical protein